MDHAPWEDKAGTFARRLAREREALWVFLDIQAHVQGGVVRGSEFCRITGTPYQVGSIPTASQMSR